jgi:hypothetical protein
LTHEGTAIFDAGFGFGPTVSFAYIPATGTRIISGGIGVSLGHNVSVGTLVGARPSSILTQWSVNAGYQVSPWRGVQWTTSTSGSLGGNTFGVPGASAAVTYGACF